MKRQLFFDGCLFCSKWLERKNTVTLSLFCKVAVCNEKIIML